MHKHTKSLTSEEGRIVWPFPSVNGQQTEASRALQSLPPEPKRSLYEIVSSDPETQEALI